jgi:hypothetical protein
LADAATIHGKSSTPGYVLPKALDDERFDFYGHK